MDPEELQALFHNAGRARRRGLSEAEAAQLDAIILERTGGQAKNMQDLAGLVGDAQVAVKPEEVPIKTSGFVGGLQQAAQGATFGGLDELSGLGDAIAAFGNKFAVPEGPTPGEAFTQGREQADRQLKGFQEENPLLSAGLQVGGGLASGVALPLAAGALRGTSALGALGRSGLIGAAEGGLAGALTADPGERGAGAAVGSTVGAAIGGVTGAAATVPRIVGSIRNFARRFKARPKPESASIGEDAVAILQSELQRPDTRFDIAGIADEIELRRKLATDPDNFTLAQTDAFSDLAAQAENFGQRTDIRELFDDALGTNAGDVLASAGMATVQPGIATARAAGSRVRSAFSAEQARRFRAVMRRLAEDLHSPDPKVQRQLLESIGASPTKAPGPLNAGIGLAPAGVQQLIEQLGQ